MDDITKTPEQDPIAALAALADNSPSQTTPEPGATTSATKVEETAAGTASTTTATEEAKATEAGTTTQTTTTPEGEVVPLSPELKFQMPDGSVKTWEDIQKESVMLKAQFTPLQQANRAKEAELADKEKFINQYVSYLNTIAEDPTLLQLVTAKHSGADTKTALKAAAITAGLDKEFGSAPQQATQTTVKKPEDVLTEKPPQGVEWGTPEYDTWKDQKIYEAIALTREQTKQDILGSLSDKEKKQTAEDQRIAAQVSANVTHNEKQLSRLEALLTEKGINYSALPQAEKQIVLQKINEIGKANSVNLFDKQYLSTNRISESEIKLIVYEALASGNFTDASKSTSSQTEGMSFIKPKVETAVKAPISGGGPSTGGPSRVAPQSNYSALDGWQDKLHQLLPQ